MSGQVPAFNEEDAVKFVTVDMIEQELGSLLKEYGNEFPDADREVIISKWIEQEGTLAYYEAQVHKRVAEEEDFILEGYAKVLYQRIVTYNVCYRALKRMIQNRTPEVMDIALVRAKNDYEQDARRDIVRLDYYLNGAKEYRVEEEEEDET